MNINQSFKTDSNDVSCCLSAKIDISDVAGPSGLWPLPLPKKPPRV